MGSWKIELTSLSAFKRKIANLKYNSHLKTCTRKYYRGSTIWVLVYEN